MENSVPLLIADFDGTSKFFCYLDSHISSYVFWFGHYSRDQFLFLKSILRADMVFFDIGANEGEHSIFVAKYVPNGRVYSFEPFAPIRTRLLENIRVNSFSNIMVLDFGLSDTPKTMPLFGADSRADDGAKNDGQSTLFSRSGISKELGSIQLQTLDAFVASQKIAKIDLMKIDVEGAELFVLKGGVNTIRACRPVLLLEVAQNTCAAAGYTTQELLRTVQELGYVIHTLADDGTTAPLLSIAQNISRDVVCYPSSS